MSISLVGKSLCEFEENEPHPKPTKPSVEYKLRSQDSVHGARPLSEAISSLGCRCNSSSGSVLMKQFSQISHYRRGSGF